MSIQFIRSNPADDSWDRMQQRLNQQRERRQAEGLDEAFRSGVQEMYGRREGMANEQPSDRRPPAGLSGVRANPQPASGNFDQQPTRSPDRARDLTGRSGVSDDLINRVITQESGGRADAVSPKGATGIMQIMPATARDPGYGVPTIFEVASQMGRRVPDQSEETLQSLLNDPAVNQAFGTLYLEAMHDQHGGDEAQALAAYNAGPGAVQRYGGIPPFQETQNYVSSIQAAGGGAGQQPQQRGGLSAIQAQPQQPQQQGGMYDPVIQRLMETPGGGQAAFQLYQGQQQSAAEAQQARQQSYDALVENAMTALANDNIEAFQYYGQQAGILDQFPPQVLQDANLRRLIGQGSVLAEEIYGADEQQSGVFMQAYLQSGGNYQQAYLTAGRPQSKPSHTLREAMIDNQNVLMRINDQTGIAEPVTTADGELVQASSSGDGSTADIRNHQFWTSLGYSQDEATRLVTQARTDPEGAAARATDTIIRAEVSRFTNPLAPEDIPARWEELFNHFLSVMTGRGPGGDPAQTTGGSVTPDYIVPPEELR